MLKGFKQGPDVMGFVLKSHSLDWADRGLQEARWDKKVTGAGQASSADQGASSGVRQRTDCRGRTGRKRRLAGQ